MSSDDDDNGVAARIDDTGNAATHGGHEAMSSDSDNGADGAFVAPRGVLELVEAVAKTLLVQILKRRTPGTPKSPSSGPSKPKEREINQTKKQCLSRSLGWVEIFEHQPLICFPCSYSWQTYMNAAGAAVPALPESKLKWLSDSKFRTENRLQ